MRHKKGANFKAKVNLKPQKHPSSCERMVIKMKSNTAALGQTRGKRRRSLSRFQLKNRSLGGYIATLIFLLACAVFMVLPLIYTVASSLKPLSELWVYPPRFTVDNPTTENFKTLVTLMNNSLVPMSRYIFNTGFIAAVGTAGNVILSSVCAYAFALRKFPGQKAMFKIIVLTLMFNTTVTQIPTFLIMSALGWLDSYLAYIIPAFATPMGFYLMRQFIGQMVPISLVEAAKLDGAGELTIVFRIVMPVVKSAWITLIIFSFQGLWAVGENVYIYQENMKTFNYALQQILAGGIARTGAAAAAAVLMMTVPAVIFIVSQSNVLETMAASGMKD